MNKQTIEEKKPYTHIRECPGCHSKIEYWWTSGMSECFPHFYCSKCSNVIWRAQDRNLVLEKGASEAILLKITSELPLCSCGEAYEACANPKCPKCGFEFKHDQTPIERLNDPHVILLEGAVFTSE